MVKINTIVKLNLETRTKNLRAEGKSQEEIAVILSEETGQQITKHTVSRYFLADMDAKAEVIERSDKLKIKVCEAELNTINQRMSVIMSLIEIGAEARLEGDRRGAVLALKTATEALHLLNQRLGKLTPNNTLIQINNNSSKLDYMSDVELIEIIRLEQNPLNQEVDCID